MKIILINGVELNPTLITGGKKNVQGATRDTLNFVFSAEEDMAVLDAAFTAEACSSITIVDDDGNEFIHKNYVVRSELSKSAVEIEKATSESEAVFETRITVGMAQATYVETQLASLTDTVDVLVMESLMA